MGKIKLYSLSKRAEMQYRTGARQAKNIPIDVLRRKISALIYASRDRFYFSPEDATIIFGTCVITFGANQVTDIRWCNDNHGSGICKKEKDALLEAYTYFSMDKNGTYLVSN